MQDAVLDACALINLLASDEILVTSTSKRRVQRKTPARASRKAVHAAFDWTLHVPGQVAAETLNVLRPDEDDARKLVKNAIDLEPLFDAGLLHRCEPQGADELELFVRLAANLDDGEAACAAVAKTRGWMLATDDRPATRLAARLGVSTLTTPELVRRWAEFTQATDAEIAAVLTNIQRFARFTPRADSKGHAWWIKKLPKQPRS